MNKFSILKTNTVIINIYSPSEQKLFEVLNIF